MSKEVSQLSETALYRKYRPQKFSDVHGQDHIVKVLESSISENRIAHAYLFSGSRGTGKTSVARIFARGLGTSENDMYEIDAASNRGIDDIRAIRDAVNTLPFDSKYKVYIVDEVHMLTKEAFNALLKTLEEPPAHAIFILATTELEKLPETVISRCQTFIFKKPSREILRNVVTTVAKKEGYTLEAGVADLIALVGDGAFRDTLGILQKVVSGGTAKKITLAEAEMLTGAPKNSLVNDFLQAVCVSSGDAAGSSPAKALTAISHAVKAGVDMKVFLELVLEKARAALLLRATGGAPIFPLDETFGEEDATFLKSLATHPSTTLSASLLAELLRAYDDVSRGSGGGIQSLPLELAVIRLAEVGVAR